MQKTISNKLMSKIAVFYLFKSFHLSPYCYCLMNLSQINILQYFSVYYICYAVYTIDNIIVSSSFNYNWDLVIWLMFTTHLKNVNFTGTESFYLRTFNLFSTTWHIAVKLMWLHWFFKLWLSKWASHLKILQLWSLRRHCGTGKVQMNWPCFSWQTHWKC